MKNKKPQFKNSKGQFKKLTPGAMSNEPLYPDRLTMFTYDGFDLSHKPSEQMAWKAMSKADKTRHVKMMKGLVENNTLKRIDHKWSDENGLEHPYYTYVPAASYKKIMAKLIGLA